MKKRKKMEFRSNTSAACSNQAGTASAAPWRDGRSVHA
jgi:hypothetical protein